MDALTKLAMKRQLTSALIKQASIDKQALKMSDVEDSLGMYLDKKHHSRVKEHIAERKKKSFSLRHPVLTGIPTLGMAPAIAKGRAVEKIKRRLLRDDKGLRKAYDRAQDKAHSRRMDEARLTIERDKADAPARAAGALAAAYVAGKQIKHGQGR